MTNNLKALLISELALSLSLLSLIIALLITN